MEFKSNYSCYPNPFSSKELDSFPDKIVGTLGTYNIKQNWTGKELEDFFSKTGMSRLEKHFQVKGSNIQLKKGAFGQIMLGVDNQSKEYVSIKITKGQQFEEEVKIHKVLSTLPSILPLIESIQQNDLYFQIAPIAGLGNLRRLKEDHLDDHQDYKEKAEICCYIAGEVLKGITSMHEKGYCHLDVKPENIVITCEGEVKIIDFGCSQRVSNGVVLASNVTGDMRYFAPERQRNYLKENNEGVLQGEKLDSFAIGLTLFELTHCVFNLSWEPICQAVSSWNDQKFHIFSYMEPGTHQVWTPGITEGFEEEGEPTAEQLKNPPKKSYWELVHNLLLPDPEERWSPSQAVNHEAVSISVPNKTLKQLIKMAYNPPTEYSKMDFTVCEDSDPNPEKKSLLPPKTSYPMGSAQEGSQTTTTSQATQKKQVAKPPTRVPPKKPVSESQPLLRPKRKESCCEICCSVL